MSNTVLRLQETVEHSESVNHWVVGAITLVILFALLFALVAFAGGREHS